MKYFVYNDEILDTYLKICTKIINKYAIKNANVETGLDGLQKVYEFVRCKYSNLTRKIIWLFISHSNISVKRKIHVETGVIIKSIIFMNEALFNRKVMFRLAGITLPISVVQELLLEDFKKITVNT